MRCDICKGMRGRFRFAKQSYSFYECAECQHLQIQPVPSHEILKEQYKEGFGASAFGANTDLIKRFAQSATGELPLQMLQKLELPKTARILDIGCSFGYDLYAIKNKGKFPNVYGVEISPGAIKIAKEVLGLKVYSDLETLTDYNLQFDFVYLKHNLEHQREPMILVEKLSKLVAPGGYLLIGVPNRRSINGLWGKRWEWMTPSNHILL